MPTKIQAQDIDTTTEFVFSELALDNGSASLPALAFSSDPNTGIYRIGADTLGITTNGAARLQVDTNATLFGDAVELRLQRTSNGRTPSISIYDAFGGFRHHTPNSNAESTTVAHQWQCNNPSTNSVLATLLANGQWQHQDGSVSIPSLSFLSDPDTGIYRPGSNQILLTAGGVAKFGVDSAGGLIATAGYLQNDNGSAVAPSFSFHTDPDTGIFRLNTNQIGVTTGGVRAFFVGSDGSINMDAGHNINFDAGTAAAPGLRGGADPDTGIFLPSANNIGFSTGGSQRMVLASNVLEFTVGTQVAAVVGSAAAPGYSFFNDLDTGFFRVADGEIGVATNSASVWKFTASALAGNNNDAKIQAADGSVSLPAYSFFNDTDTGIYRSGTNSMIITLGGVNQWDFNANGALRGQSSTTNLMQAGFGSNTTPGYGFTGDEDTGMYRSASNIIKFAAGGAEVLQVSTGTIEVRNTAQFQPAAGNAGSPGIGFNDDNDTGIYRSGTNSLSITANAAQVAQFSATGSSDSVRYTPLNLFGAQAFGGGTAAMQFSLQSTASVSTTPVEIIGTEYGFIVVNGVTGGGAGIFTDLLLSHYSNAPTLVSAKNSGSTAARTYTLTSGDRISLAMASGTWNIMCTFFRCPIR